MRRQAQAIAERIGTEERKKAAQRLIEGLDARKGTVPRGFVRQAVREKRKPRS
jgi:hypothetical protein